MTNVKQIIDIVLNLIVIVNMIFFTIMSFKKDGEIKCFINKNPTRVLEIDFVFKQYDNNQGMIREEDEVEIQVKYEGYIDKEREVADKLKRLEDVKLSPDFDYNALHSLTIEARQKLTKHKPQTLGQASRISGVSPADISVLAVFLGR